MKRRRLFVALLVMLFLFAFAMPTLMPHTTAQSGGGYDLTWNTVDGGGYTFSMGSGYSLGGTIGQPDAGTLSGGGYMLVGGFWGGAGPAGEASQYHIYLPLVLKNH